MDQGTHDEPPAIAWASDALRDVAAERRRQIEAEGWTPERDDGHGDHSMAIAAACYALADVRAALAVQTVHVDDLWQWTGWSSSWFKPKDKRRNMIRAAALLLAEIERMDRHEPPNHENKNGQPGARRHPDNETVVLPYTPELEASIKAIQASLNGAIHKLDAMLEGSADDVAGRLMASAGLLRISN